MIVIWEIANHIMHRDQARKLLQRFREGNLSEEERILLESWYLESAQRQPFGLTDQSLRKHLEELQPSTPPKQPLFRSYRNWAAIAASVVILLSAAFLLWPKAEQPTAEVVLEGDALPGDHRARLILDSGKKIVLDETENGMLAREGNTSILKTAEGQLIYRTAGDASVAYLSHYNTIETPKAGQYHVQLSDGTNVWLNAASSIRFPAEFGPEERIVEVVGEVYFEVAQAVRDGKRVPFKVMSAEQVVEVLGTRFNINSYSDEGMVRTTLLEGSIRVETPQKGITLAPGQQARVAAGQPPKVRAVNTGQVVAWKEGFFSFDGIGLKELMRQLSRWYDMEVTYVGDIPDHEFVGRISRQTNLSSVLKILEAGGVHFRVEGNKIIVTD